VVGAKVEHLLVCIPGIFEKYWRSGEPGSPTSRRARKEAGHAESGVERLRLDAPFFGMEAAPEDGWANGRRCRSNGEREEREESEGEPENESMGNS